MKFTLKKHNVDDQMIELYYNWLDKQYLAGVMHIDCFDDDEFREALQEDKSLTVELTLST